jgi:hypothetical protein
MMLKDDHFTPLSRAVASIDRDDYAARFAVYDREHKALLRRLATAAAPVSAADVASQERAFRDAIRRIEFGDDEHEPTLVPQDEPVSEAPPEPRPDPTWPQPRPARRDTLDVADLPGVERDTPAAAVEPVIPRARSRPMARRVGERLALGVVVLILLGAGLWMLDGRRGRATDPVASLRGATDASRPAAADYPADTRAAPPNWLSPQMLFAPSIAPPSPPPASSPRPPSSPSPSSPIPRAEVPLPLPRPEI